MCGLDTEGAWMELKRSRGRKRLLLERHWGIKGNVRRTLWDADHIIPVVEGGGACDLSNIRTLCVLCHRQVTSELRERRPGQKK